MSLTDKLTVSSYSDTILTVPGGLAAAQMLDLLKYDRGTFPLSAILGVISIVPTCYEHFYHHLVVVLHISIYLDCAGFAGRVQRCWTC